MSTCNRGSEVARAVNDGETSFVWDISSYSRVVKRPEVRLNSPTFRVNDRAYQRFRLDFYPGGREGTSDWTSLNLVRVSPADLELGCKCKLSLSIGPETIQTKEFVQVFGSSAAKTAGSDVWGFARFAKLARIEQAFVANAASSRDVVRIRCEVVVINRIMYDKVIARSLSLSSSPTNPNKRRKIEHRTSFEWIFLDESTSDVSLRFPEASEQQNAEPVPAHKLVLAGASLVFRAMFNADMLEKRRNVVDILDVRREIVVEMLRHVYTGALRREPEPSHAEYCELLAAADKYLLEGLRHECETELRSMLSLDNCVTLLSHAEKHNAPELRKDGLDYARAHLAELVDGEQIKGHASPFVLDIIRSLLKE